MKIEIPRRAVVGEIKLEAGEYLVSPNVEGGSILLTGKGGTFKIHCTKRPFKGKVRSIKVNFGPGMGGPFWTLTLLTPPQNEWVAFFKLEPPSK